MGWVLADLSRQKTYREDLAFLIDFLSQVSLSMKMSGLFDCRYKFISWILVQSRVECSESELEKGRSP